MSDMKVAYVGDKKIDLEGLDLETMSPEGFDAAKLADTALVLIDYFDQQGVLDICREIRQASRAGIYLKPIVILTGDGQKLGRTLSAGVDHSGTYVDFAKFLNTQYLPNLKAINEKISTVHDLQENNGKSIASRILSYMYTRSISLTPVMTSNSRQGYIYPAIELFVQMKDDSIFKTMDFLEVQRLISGEFVDKMYRCSRCGSAFMNFREVCSHCGSANLDLDDLVHHFRCAYVAPLRDFESGEKMVCPKCERQLKQIGVDYDKPSSIYVCKDCGHTSQEASTVAVCYNCLTKNPPENLELRTVKKYSLTALGENAAVHGIDQLFMEVLGKELEFVPMTLFKKVLSFEIERIKRYKVSESSIFYLSIRNLHDIYLESGTKAKEIFKEFAGIIKSILRTSDMITSMNESSFLILLIETPDEGAQTAADRVRERINALISENLRTKADLLLKSLPVKENATPEDLIEEVINQ